MKTYIVGSSGYIGSYIIERIGMNEDVYILSSSQNDNKQHFLSFNLLEPSDFNYNNIDDGSSIIFLSAISSPDKCEKDYDYAYKINVEGTQFFINKCLEKKCKVIFFSSDTVYGAQEGTLDENSSVNPMGSYASMKHRIEQQFQNNSNFKILRLSYVFSKNDKFMQYLQSCSSKHNVADIFHPFYRNIVWIEDLYSLVLKLLDDWTCWEGSIINVSGDECLSRVDLTEMYKRNIDSTLKFEITSPSEQFFETRPKRIELKSQALPYILQRVVTPIEVAMFKEFEI